MHWNNFKVQVKPCTNIEEKPENSCLLRQFRWNEVIPTNGTNGNATCYNWNLRKHKNNSVKMFVMQTIEGAVGEILTKPLKVIFICIHVCTLKRVGTTGSSRKPTYSTNCSINSLGTVILTTAEYGGVTKCNTIFGHHWWCNMRRL